MHLKLVRSGGLAGLTMVASVDSADLPSDQQGLIALLLTLGVSPKPDAGQRGGPDQFSYQLEIHQGEHSVRHHWDEPDVPEMVRPLLAALVNEARPAH
ncbi:MAG: protealysin inhibitor emfourin [Actinomycetota bacterium]